MSNFGNDPSGSIPDYLSTAAASSDIPKDFQFTPSISEETLTYTIHLPPASDDQDEESAARTYITLIDTHVEELLSQGQMETVNRFPGGAGSSRRWLWHKDPWELRLVPENDLQDRRYIKGVPSASPRPVATESDSESDSGEKENESRGPTAAQTGRKLEGRMRIGDAVDDEWLVVYLLRSISALQPELIISIRDTDGEFLLIEAANHLPRWVSPENVENRFWLAAGRLHLIPLDEVSTNTERTSYAKRARQRAVDKDEDVDMDAEGAQPDNAWLSESDGVRLIRASLEGVRDGQGRFWAGQEVEHAVMDRISAYPGALRTHHQRALAYLPDIIARALRSDPALIQRAIEGFYTRDPIQVRNASRSTHFFPKADTTVLAPVIMTRTSYAQLSGQVFHPPRTFGPEWRIPPATDTASAEECARLEIEKRRRDLGIKITVGFEIMYKEDARKSRTKGKGTEFDVVDQSDPGYQRYLAGLKKAGFFGEEVDGSRVWKERLKKAQSGWLGVLNKESSQRVSFAESVDAAITATHDATLMDLAAASTFQEDNDDWLTVSPEELDGILARAGGPPRETPKDPLAILNDESDQPGEEEAKELRELAAKVNQFVEGRGDLQGAQFQDELSDDDMLGSDSDDDSGDEAEASDEMTDALRAKRMAELIPALKPEEWGVQAQASSAKQVAFAAETTAGQKPRVDDRTLEMRPPVLERDNFDGVVVDSDDDDSESEPFDWAAAARQTNKKQSTIKNINNDIDPNTTLLADALREGKDMPTANLKPTTGEEMAGLSDEEEEDEDRRDVWDEAEVDMAAEQDDFLKFAREALGINDDAWTRLLDERQSRGAFVPEPIEPALTQLAAKAEKPKKPQAKTPTTPRGNVQPDPPSASIGPLTPAIEAEPIQLAPGERNPRLDTFEKVMEAMEEELARAKAEKAAAGGSKGKQGAGSKASPAPTQATSSVKGSKDKATGKKLPGKGVATPLPSLPTEADLDSMTEAELAEMDRELKAALKSAGMSDDEDDEMFDDDDEGREMKAALGGLGGGDKAEFRMMKDFLASYQAQEGGSGAVGNLFARLSQGRDGGKA